MKLMNKRPYDSGVLIIGAGALILAIGLIAFQGYYGVGDHSGTDLILILVGTLSGIGMVASGALSLVIPEKHKLLGAIAMILSISSFAGTSGGLYIGAIGGLLGGIMGISWHGSSRAKGSEKGSSQDQ